MHQKVSSKGPYMGKTDYGNNKNCSSRQDSVNQDLKLWFGYDQAVLPNDLFEKCFTDVAHAGEGLFEKLIVLGTKTLEAMAEIYFSDLFESDGSPHLPKDLSISHDPNLLKYLWAQKRVERVTSPHALYAFGKCYLACAQSLPSKRAVVKYVKSCIGFGCHNKTNRDIHGWLPGIIRHLYWVQRLDSEKTQSENDILQDIQEYLGYNRETLLPRIKDQLNFENHMDRYDDQKSGDDLLMKFSQEYFKSASEAHIELEVGGERDWEKWVNQQAKELLESEAPKLFASIFLSLNPFISGIFGLPLPESKINEEIFKGLVASCWLLSSEKDGPIWILLLIQRLRQLQLLIKLNNLRGDSYKEDYKLRKYLEGIPLNKLNTGLCSAIPNSMISKFDLWHMELDQELSKGAQSNKLIKHKAHQTDSLKSDDFSQLCKDIFNYPIGKPPKSQEVAKMQHANYPPGNINLKLRYVPRNSDGEKPADTIQLDYHGSKFSNSRFGPTIQSGDNYDQRELMNNSVFMALLSSPMKDPSSALQVNLVKSEQGPPLVYAKNVSTTGLQSYLKTHPWTQKSYESTSYQRVPTTTFIPHSPGFPYWQAQSKIDEMPQPTLAAPYDKNSNGSVELSIITDKGQTLVNKQHISI